MNNCLFCKIISGEIPSTKVYEDKHSLAFLDIHPNNPGHTLVVPKDHFENIYTLPDEALARLMLTVKKVAIGVKDGVSADGINLIMNNEEPAGQIIFHAHVHIIPRIKGDGFEHWKQGVYKEGEAEEVAKQIRKSLEA